MPQVDLESLVSACAGVSSDRKVACETIATADEHDWPPESIWLSGDAESDWWDRNAVVYERKESTKGNSIFACSSSNPGSNNNSQRFSKNLKSKAAIIGLPKSQKSAFADAKIRRNHHHHHHRPGSTTLFPKRSTSVGRSDAAAMFEPSSPKVSCIGRVRSRRDRNRRLRTRQWSSSSSTATSAAVISRDKSSRSGRRKTGFFESIRAIFRSGRRGKPVQKPDLSSGDSTSTTKKKKKRSNSRKSRGGSTSNKASQNYTSFEESATIEPPSLGGLNRFASGRRSESWRVE